MVSGGFLWWAAWREPGMLRHPEPVEGKKVERDSDLDAQQVSCWQSRPATQTFHRGVGWEARLSQVAQACSPSRLSQPQHHLLLLFWFGVG